MKTKKGREEKRGGEPYRQGMRVGLAVSRSWVWGRVEVSVGLEESLGAV